MQTLDILWVDKWDHHESENRILHAILTLIVVEISISRHVPAFDIASAGHSEVTALCLIWLHIFKGCFVDLGNGFWLTIRTN